MLKKICCILFFTLSFFFTTQANQSCEAKCPIYEWTPDFLINYTQNLRKVIQNINGEVKKNTPRTWVDRDLGRLKSRITKWYNLFSSWWGYFSYFRFYVTYTISSEYIPEIWRDYDILDRETKQLDRYIKSVWENGYQDISLTKIQICEGVLQCNFEGNIIDVLIALQANHEKIKEYFRLSILWENSSKELKDFQLVEENFTTEFRKYYNENTTKNCSSCSGAYWTIVKESMERIDQNMEYASAWIQEWKNAWDLLVGWVDASTAQKIERDLLKKELGRQWVSAEQWEKILQNLDEFNARWLSTVMSNNFITNSFNYFVKMITPQINEFNETITQSFEDAQGNKKPVVSIADFNQTAKQISNTSLVQQRIAELYNKELPSLWVGNRSIDETVAKLMEMHYDVSKSVEYLDKAAKFFEAVCLYQANGMWKCN